MATKAEDVSSRLLKAPVMVRSTTVAGQGSSQAAEDGRRRAHTLPPISREHTKLQSPSKSTASSQLSRDYTFLYKKPEHEVGGSHWHLKQRHLQARTDEKIINHLKKKLNKRILKRLNAYFWDDGKEQDGKIQKELAIERNERERLKKSRDRRRSRRTDIFSQYNEFGERILGQHQRSTSEDNIPLRRLLEPLPVRSRSISPGRTVPSSYTNGDELPSSPAKRSSMILPNEDQNSLTNNNTEKLVNRALPEIIAQPSRKDSGGSRKSSGILKSGHTSRRSSGHRVTLTQPLNSEDIESVEQAISKAYDDDVGDTVDAGIKPDDEAAIDNEIETIQRGESPTDELEDFKHLVVSPVPTPQVYRPETRDGMKLTVDDRVSKILQGRLNVGCPPDHKILRVYVSSAITDSQAELGHLLQSAYPVLRQYSLERGCELQFIDPHWGMRDTVTDDHALPELCLQMVETCQETRGINFISFVGQKYGNVHLPSKIQVHEFEAIVDAVEQDWKQQLRDMAIGEMKRIEARAAEAAQKAKDAEEGEDNKEGSKLSRRLTAQAINPNDSPTDSSQQKQSSVPLAQVDSGLSFTIADSPEVSPDEHAEVMIPDWADESKVQEFVQRIKTDANLSLSLSRRSGIELGLEPALLRNWYKQDDNALPPIYTLQPISTMYKDINTKDGSKRQQAKTSWLTISQKLLHALQEYSGKLFDKETADKFFMSLCDMEHEHGLVEADDSESHCLWFKREITDIMTYVGDAAARDFLDLLPTKAVVEPRQAAALKTLTDTMTQKLLPTRIKRNLVAWGKEGINSTLNRPHRIYLERMCEDFVDVMKTNIDQIVQDKKHTHGDTDGLFEEIASHVNLCHGRAKEFHGRKDLMNLVKAYVRSKCRQPLVAFGQSGRGKTSLVCRAAKDIHKWFKGTSVAVIMRSIGATSESTNVRMLLKTISLQLCHIYGHNECEVPDDFKGLVNDFDNRICSATEEKPLVIVIDSLDQLSDENEGRKLSWLPKELPPNVHMILSTLPGEAYGTLDALKKLYQDNNDDIFLEVPDLPPEDANVILEHWLRKSNRTLTSDQHAALINAFKTCPTPLYLKVVFFESLRWPSHLQASDIKLSNTVGKIATVLYGRLEKDFGELVVKRTLGYITASRNGVMNSEMEDLLSLDDPVMAEVTSHYQQSIRRCPPVIWLRLKQALSQYLVERSADGVKTYSWFHSQFQEAAVQRYLNQRDKAPSYHKAMAEYFLGRWSNGRPKPFLGNDVGVDRFVASQPLFFSVLNEADETRHRVYNRRKLSELPWHLLKSQQFPSLKSDCLCNFEWVLAKLCATSLRAVLDDCQMALAIEPKDKDLLLLTETLQLSHKVLEVDPKQLASQMVGRLHRIITKDVPVAPQDPLVYPAMHPFFKQARKGSFPALVPSSTCLAEPGGILFDVLSGHTDVITAVTVTSDGLRALTAAKDDSLKLWNLGTGKVTKTIKGVGADVLMLRLACNNRLAISSEKKCIRVWDMNSGTCIHSHDDFIDPAILTIAGEGTLLVSIFDGANALRSWDLTDNMKMLQNIILEEKSIHKDRSIMVSHGCHGDQVLHGYRSSNWATVQNCRTGKVVHKLKTDEKSSSIRSLGMSREYFIVASKVPFMQLNEIFVLELFDIQKGKYLRTVRGCAHDNITGLYVNNLGSHAMCVVANSQTNTSNIAIWNLETEDHKHLAHHVDVSVIAACGDFRYCLTGSQSDNTLRVWNLSGTINKPASKLRQNAGVESIIPMQDNPRYAIGKTIGNGSLSVWNVVNSKCKGNAVRNEHGLVGPNDVVLIYNANVYILTDRALSNVSEDTQQVFQTVHIYDLKTKRYVNRVTSYIVPSPPHEYVLLDADTLMGLNDSRGHFVMWNMSSGRVVDRMKAVHPDVSLKYDNHLVVEEAKERVRKRHTTAKMTPWERRAETLSAQNKRREFEIEQEKQALESVKKEKDNAIEQFVISADQSTLVASYYAHHLCVFDVQRRSHVHTLENPDSMLFLHVAAITADGSFLVHTNYDDASKTSYITVWDCKKGTVRKRLKNEKDVCSVALTEDGCRIVFAKTNNELRVWHPFETTSLRKMKGYKGMNFKVGAKIHMMHEGKKAVVFSGDVSLWDIEKGEYLAVFTPDMNIQCCSLVMDGNLIAIGLRDSTSVITLKYKAREITEDDTEMGQDIFGEIETSDEEEDEDDEED